MRPRVDAGAPGSTGAEAAVARPYDVTGGHTSRRDFLRRAGMAASGALALSASGPWTGWIERAIAEAAAESTVSGGRIAVRIGGQHAGYLVIPGTIPTQRGTATSVRLPSAISTMTTQQILARAGSSMTIEFGAGMSKAWFDWVAGRINAAGSGRDGALVFLNDAQRIESRKRFTGASIVELTLPGLDAGSKDPATVTAKLIALSSSIQGAEKTEYTPKPTVGKAWNRSQFSLEIDGLPSKKVKRIEAMTFRFPAPSGTGATSGTTGVTLPALRITVDASDMDPFAKWYQDFVIDGKNDASSEKAGQLRWLANDGVGVLGSLDFQGLGPFELKRPDLAASQDNLAEFQMSMYVERVQASFAGMA